MSHARRRRGWPLLAVVAGLDWTSLAAAGADPPTARPATDPVVRLDDGVTATVAGLAAVSRPASTWTASGAALDAADRWRLPDGLARLTGRAYNPRVTWYAVVMRFQSEAVDPPYDYAYDLDETSQGQYQTFKPKPGPRPEAGTYRGIVSAVGPTRAAGRLSFIVAAGRFMPSDTPPTVDEGYGGSGIAVTGSCPAGKYVIGRPLLQRPGGDLVLPVTTSVSDYQYRVVATVADQGQARRVVAQQVDGDSADGLKLDLLALPGVRDVKAIRTVSMEFRPLSIVFVDHLALRPGQGTHVEVSSHSLATTRPDGTPAPVSVGGDVGLPGLYAISPSIRRVSDLLRTAGRPNEPGEVVSLFRKVADTTGTPVDDVPLGTVTAGSPADLPLRPGDEVLVRVRR